MVLCVEHSSQPVDGRLGETNIKYQKTNYIDVTALIIS